MVWQSLGKSIST